MSEVITKLVVNCETGEQTVVPLTAEELAQREVDAAAALEAKAAQDAEIAAKAAAKADAIAALVALGLTEAQVAALTA
jgi:Holliday junction resolvasome RuvABC DNA-binding subunit